MTTGEIAKGRLMIASITALPFHLWRTSSSAQPTPKIVFSGTAIATMSRVSFSACRPFGEVIASIGGADPVFEGLVEDHHQRREQQQGQVAEPEDAQAPAAAAPLPTWPRALTELIVASSVFGLIADLPLIGITGHAARSRVRGGCPSAGSG